MKRPPDKNKRCTVKIKLNDIYNTNLIQETVNNVNELIEIAYLFIKGYILFSIENGMELPNINKDFIAMAFSVINGYGNSGRPFNDDKNTQITLLTFYFSVFSKQTGIIKKSFDCISYILGQESEKMYISIINNIKYHFDDHIKRYIRGNFIEKYQQIREDKDKEKLKQFHSDMNKILNDILNKTKTSPQNYHQWIDDNVKLIIPNSYTSSSFEMDIENNNFNYIKCMYHMNKLIQSKNLKSLCIFPIKHSSYNNYVKFNTAAIIDLFYGNTFVFGNFTKADVLHKNGDSLIQELVWNIVFNLKEHNGKYKFKHNGFSFNYEMETDGYAVSLNFINDDEVSNKEQKKGNLKKGRDDTNKIKETIKRKLIMEMIEQLKLDGVPSNQLILSVNNKFNNKEFKKEFNLKIDNLYSSELGKKQLATKMKNEEHKQNNKKKKDDNLKVFKAKSKEEKEILKIEKNSSVEFPYIEYELVDELKRKKFEKIFNEGKIAVVDPGKRSILYMMSSNKSGENNKPETINTKVGKTNSSLSNYGVTKFKGKTTFNYTSATRNKCLKRERHVKMIDKWKSTINLNTFPENISEEDFPWYMKTLKQIEGELSFFNSNICNHNEFLNYVTKRMEYLKKMKLQYDSTFLQKLKWFEYLDKTRHELQLLENIGNIFGQDVTIIIGDWSNKGIVKYRPTPGIALRRLISKKFSTYLIDEYNTSSIHNEHHIKCENLSVPIIPVNIEKEIVLKKSVPNKKILKSIIAPKLSTEIIKTQITRTTIKKNTKTINKKKVIKQQSINITDEILNKYIKSPKTIELENVKPTKKSIELKKTITDESLKVLSIKRDNLYDSIKGNLDNEGKIILNEDFAGKVSSLLGPIPIAKDFVSIKHYTTKSLHAVLTYKIVSKMVLRSVSSGCINRDKNSVLNMLNIVLHLIKTGERPNIFNRTVTQYDGKLETLMDVNHIGATDNLVKLKSQKLLVVPRREVKIKKVK